MNCQDINEKMSLYIDNLLEASDKSDFEKHLSECSDCMEAYELISSNVKLCNEIPEFPLPKNFKENLHNKLIIEKRKNKLIKKDWRTYGVVAAAVLIVFVSALQNTFLDNKTQDIAKEESSSVGSKWTLANDSAEELQMDIASTPEERGSSQEPMMMMTASDDDFSEPEFDGREEGISGEDINASERMYSGVRMAKTYEGIVSVQDVSLEQMTEFIEPYLSERSDIIIEANENETKIKLIMPTESFIDCLNYVTQYSNVTGYNVDINNYTKEYDALNDEKMALKQLATDIQKETENEEKNLQKLKDIEEVQIPEKDTALSKIEEEIRKATIVIEIIN